MGLSAGYHSPTLTYGRAMQSRKSLCEPLRSTKEAEKGSLQTLESPTVFAETGEVQVLVRSQGAQHAGTASAVLMLHPPAVCLMGLAPSDLLELLFTPTPTHLTPHPCSHVTTATEVHFILARVKAAGVVQRLSKSSPVLCCPVLCPALPLQ